MTLPRIIRFTLLALLNLGLLLPNLAQAESKCDRACLAIFANSYLESLVGHSVKNLALATDVKVTSNGETVHPGEGLWKTASSIEFKELFLDPISSQAAAFSVIKEGDTFALVASRLKIANNHITEIENLVAREGAHPLFAPMAVIKDARHYDEVLPTNQRPSRQQLLDAANAYFDGIEASSPDNVPFHDNCLRFENGVRTTNNPEVGFTSGCAEGFSFFTYITEINNRRYPVVDTERGVVLGFVTFQVPGTAKYAIRNGQRVEIPERSRTPRTIYIAESFRLIDGKIRDIEAYMKNLPFGTQTGWLDN